MTTMRSKIEAACGMDMAEIKFYATLLGMSVGFFAGVVGIFCF